MLKFFSVFVAKWQIGAPDKMKLGTVMSLSCLYKFCQSIGDQSWPSQFSIVGALCFAG